MACIKPGSRRQQLRLTQVVSLQLVLFSFRASVIDATSVDINLKLCDVLIAAADV